MGVHEGGVTFGRFCCHVTAKSGVFDCTAMPGTVLVLTGVFFSPVLISTVPEMIVKRAELIFCSVSCSPSKETNINLPRKSIFFKKLIANRPKMIARRDVYRKDRIRPLLLEPTKAVGMTGELTKGKFKGCARGNQTLWKRRKSVQASRKCTFAPLAGANAPDPYAAFGREVARPQAAEKKCCYYLAVPSRVCLQKPHMGFFFLKFTGELSSKKKWTQGVYGRFSPKNSQKKLAIYSMPIYNVRDR